VSNHTHDERLVQRIAFALHGVRESGGYYDTARQVLDHVSDLFPEQVESAKVIADLRAEVRSLEFQRDTAVLQLQAHIARARRER